MEYKINWDSKRTKHAIERMTLRGISVDEVLIAIKTGKKSYQKKTKLMEAFLRHFSVVYDEKVFKDRQIRKIYPITVKLW
ncbi:MAG: DUF4258 domain-containing protein [Candidatus Thermoplasmatota archaeon]